MICNNINNTTTIPGTPMLLYQQTQGRLLHPISRSTKSSHTTQQEQSGEGSTTSSTWLHPPTRNQRCERQPQGKRQIPLAKLPKPLVPPVLAHLYGQDQTYVQQPTGQQGGQRGLKRKYVERTYGQTMPQGTGNYPIVDELDTLDAFELYERNVLNGYDATVGTGTKFQFTLSEKQVGAEQAQIWEIQRAFKDQKIREFTDWINSN